MGGIFYLIGIVLAGYAGSNGFEWYFIFISSLIMAIGFSIIRAPQISNVASSDGISAVPKLFLMQIVLYSIITTPIYFISTMFS